MKKTFADGDAIELRGSGCTGPPGWKGQAGSRSSCWFRVNNGEWEIGSARSMHANMAALECAESVSEFRKLLEIA